MGFSGGDPKQKWPRRVLGETVLPKRGRPYWNRPMNSMPKEAKENEPSRGGSNRVLPNNARTGTADEKE